MACWFGSQKLYVAEREKEVAEIPTARSPNHREHGKESLLHYSVCLPATLSGQAGRIGRSGPSLVHCCSGGSYAICNW